MTYIEPLLFFFLLLSLLGLALHKRYLIAVGLASIFLVSWHPAAWLLSRPLETLYPAVAPDTTAAQAIVVPGGDFDDPTAERPLPLADRETYGRCMMAAWLYNTGPHVPVVVSGHWETGIMRRILQAEGLPPWSIWEETAARSTHENAVFSARILKDHGISRIVLVSEGTSMLRAKMSFEKQGLTVTPAIWIRVPHTFDLKHLIPAAKALKSNEDTLHELVGLLWYRWRGWI